MKRFAEKLCLPPRLLFLKSGRPPASIETVARTGYRFISALTCDSAADEQSALAALARPVELYEYVGRGRSHLVSGSYFELPSGVDAFRAAIAIDATYAPAHAGLARRAACGSARRHLRRRRPRRCARWR